MYVFSTGELVDELSMEICVAGDRIVWQVHIPSQGGVFECAGEEFAFQVFLCSNDGSLCSHCHQVF
jgi:hypothetical protein